MFRIPTKHLLLVNGLLWTAIGTKIAITGVVRKYAGRIMAMQEPRTSVFKTFSLKGYLIIAFMITLGITLKRIPQVPDSFIAWFYCGLGPGLLSAGVRFIIRWWKSVHSK